MTDQNQSEELKKEDFFKDSSVYLGKSRAGSFSWVLLIEAIIVCAIISFIYLGLQEDQSLPVRRAVGWDTLSIDGNRNKHAVKFPHRTCGRSVVKKRLDSMRVSKQGPFHQRPAGFMLSPTRADCRFCHHMSVPGGGPSSCANCHRSMLDSVSIFNHDYHEKVCGKNPSCSECHIGDKAKENVKACEECHKKYSDDLKLVAMGYKAAMHKACSECHEEVDLTGKKETYEDCKICHADIDKLMKR